MSSCELVPEKVEEGSAALLKLLDNDRLTKSKKLLASAAPILLQIDFVKIPKVNRRTIRIPLKHSLLVESSDVCLIVADLIRGRKVNHEVTINHYKKLFEKRGIFDAQKLHIMSSRQIRVDFSPFEAKRKLCKMFDVFLIDEKISNYLRPKLGKEFPKARKVPIPIRMRRKNLKNEILSKLMKTSFVLDGSGTTKTVQVGHVNMSASQIMENIMCVSKYIEKHFPGGWDNIRSLHIKGLRSVSLPIYMSLIPRNRVPTPTLNRKRKKGVIATQEISIVGTKVSVYRSGRFRIHKRPSSDNKKIEIEDFEPQVKRQKVNNSKKMSSKRKIEDGDLETKEEEIECDDSTAHVMKKQKKPNKAQAAVKKTDHRISSKGNKDEKNLSKKLNNKKRTECQSPCENNETTVLTNIGIAPKEENNETKVFNKSKIKRPIHNQSLKGKEKKIISELKKKKKRKPEAESKIIKPKIVEISNDAEIKDLVKKKKIKENKMTGKKKEKKIMEVEAPLKPKLKKKRTVPSNTDPRESDSPKILNKDKSTNIYKKTKSKQTSVVESTDKADTRKQKNTKMCK